MSENKDETKVVPADDKELDDLLDSALQDMVPPPRKESIGGSSIKEGAVDGVEWNPSENVWSEEFLQNAAATFQSNMAALLSSMKGVPEDSISQEQITATFQMMAEAAAQVMKPGENDDQDDPPIDDGVEKPKPFNDVNAAIAQTLESLNANTDSLQDPFNEENLNKMFSGLNLANPEDGSGANMFVPFMQEMMQSLLSKEVLYPSLKDIVEKYPMWLMDNKDKLSSEDFERYSKQNKLMANVCSELESENDADPEDVKKKRFEKVLGLMQQMQELGQPPEELAGENADLLAPSLPMGGAPPMGDPNQCRPM